MRIVAGKYRGIVLNTFDLDNIRPTADKVREAVFSKIQFNIIDTTWLDLFGGTGAIGLEALSRGAKSVVVADDNMESIKLIEKNYAKCKTKPTLIKTNFIKTLSYLSDKNEKFDFIFLDPPFNTNYGIKSIKLISEYDLLNDGGTIIFEHEREMKNFSLPNNMEIIDTKHYGTISVTYIKKIGEKNV